MLLPNPTALGVVVSRTARAISNSSIVAAQGEFCMVVFASGLLPVATVAQIFVDSTIGLEIQPSLVVYVDLLSDSLAMDEAPTQPLPHGPPVIFVRGWMLGSNSEEVYSTVVEKPLAALAKAKEKRAAAVADAERV